MIRVICTGKGSHREFFMRSFEFVSFVTGRTGNGVQWSEAYSKWREAGHKPLKKSYTWTCRRCNPVRETQMKAKTLRTALDGLQAAGETALDISQLPY